MEITMESINQQADEYVQQSKYANDKRVCILKQLKVRELVKEYMDKGYTIVAYMEQRTDNKLPRWLDSL